VKCSADIGANVGRQGSPFPGGATQAEGSIDVYAEGFIPIETDDTSLGPQEEVKDDIPLFESDDFKVNRDEIT
jgi:hypothetical protein